MFCSKCTQSPKPFAVNLADATGTIIYTYWANFMCLVCCAGGVWVSGLSWNPGQPECFAVYLSNGCISVWENQGTSGIDSESESVKQNSDHQNPLIVCFYMLL